MKDYLIITGASQGIGMATAKHFIVSGWKVINLSRSPCKIPKVTNFSIDLGSIDLGSSNWRNKWRAPLRESIENPNRICLVHNAAVYHEDSIVNLDLADLKASLAVNTIAPIMLNQMFIDLMPTGSSIIYIGSTLSEKAVRNKASYTISKHALAGAMKATCEDLATFKGKIHTCCICPGFTKTKMLMDSIPKEKINLIKQLVAANRLVEPDEIAKTIYFCATNPVINGAMLHANLGQLTVR